MGGASRGGELSLLLASRYPQFKAVVATVPSSIVNGGYSDDEDSDLEPAWTYGGEPIPYFISRRGRADGPIPEPGVPFALDPGLPSLAGRKQDVVREVSIPVEQINGPVILISGKDDAMWPSTLYSETDRRAFRGTRPPLSRPASCLRGRRPHDRPTVGSDDCFRQFASRLEDPLRLWREPEGLG